MSNENQESTRESSLQIDLLTWYELNKRNVFIGLGVIVVAVAVTMVYNHRRESTVSDASRDLLLLLAPGKNPDKSPDATKLLEIAGRHSGAPASVHATLLAARELFNAGKYSEARVQFDKAADAEGVLGAIALYGLASCVDAEKGGAEAITAYQGVIAHPQGAFIAGKARLAKARLHEGLKQPKEALALYEELARDKDRELANSAFIRRAALIRANPELNKPASMTNSISILPALKP
jgi:tetratricopeptide (TPR) repeat protein